MNEKSFAEKFEELVGKEKASKVFAVDPFELTNEDVQVQLKEEGFFGEGSAFLLGKMRDALLGQRQVANPEPLYGSEIARQDDLQPNYESLFKRSVITKERFSHNLQVATWIWDEMLGATALHEDEGASSEVKESVCRDLAVFLSRIEGFAQLHFVTSQPAGGSQSQRVVLVAENVDRFHFDKKRHAIVIPKLILRFLAEDMAFGMPDEKIDRLQKCKVSLFHETMHAMQEFNSPHFLELSLFMYGVFAEDLIKALEENSDDSVVGNRIVDDLYTLFPHEFEAYTAESFFEEVFSLQSEQNFVVAEEYLSYTNQMNEVAQGFSQAESVAQKASYISEYVDTLSTAKQLLFQSMADIKVGFGSFPKSEYQLTSDDILGFVGELGERPVTIRWLRSTYQQHLKKCKDLIYAIKTELDPSEQGHQEIAQTIFALEQELNQQSA